MEQIFFEKRSIYLWGVVDDKSARDIVTKLLLLDADKPGEPIHFYINSPGGVVTSGMVMFDTMNLIKSPVHTICMGLAASMGSILLSMGEKGKRTIFPHGEVMIHQPSLGGYFQATSADIEIQAEQIRKTKELGAQILAKNCNKSMEQIMADFDRDYWMNAKEGVQADEDALHVIAQKADGAMRDALSIFDQVVAFCGRNLNYQGVIQNLNVLDYDYYFRLTDMIFKEDIPASLMLFNDVLNKGFDSHHFITGLGAHFRNLLVCKDAITVQLLEVTESVAAKYTEQAQQADLRLLITAMELVNSCDEQYRTSKHPRLLVELTLMQACSILYNQREGEKKN